MGWLTGGGFSRYALSGRRVLPQAHKKEETIGFLLFVNLPLALG